MGTKIEPFEVMREIRPILEDLIWPAAMLITIWMVFLMNEAYGLNLNQWGLQPRSLRGIGGIISMPFLHGDVEHIFSNSLPLFIAHALLIHFYPIESLKIWSILFFFSGFGVWLYAEAGSNHIGASGLVYGLVAFIIASGLFKKNRKLLAAGGILIFFYGSMVWGVFPQLNFDLSARISWEGHLSGAFSGIITAWVFKNKGPQNEVYFDDEDDEDDEGNDPGYDEWMLHQNTNLDENARPLRINIRYIPNDKKD